jgi:hypothetical protein
MGLGKFHGTSPLLMKETRLKTYQAVLENSAKFHRTFLYHTEFRVTSTFYAMLIKQFSKESVRM